MPDRQFADPHLAALYDPLVGREARADFNFYLPLILAAESVLDIGCGTGALLHWARERGHAGRLTGLDPAVGMLTVARTRDDIEWMLGDPSTLTTDREFDLVVMSGHAFQVFLADDELQNALLAIHRALRPGGVFAFETRNPAARAWEQWTAGHSLTFTAPDGSQAAYTAEVEEIAGEIVRFRASYTKDGWEAPEYSMSTLRFLDAGPLNAFLVAAGFEVVEQFGDWDRTPVSPSSPEIITLARRR